jgi:hypothetical protein
MSAHRYAGKMKFGGRGKTEELFKTPEQRLRERIAKAVEAGARARRRIEKKQARGGTVPAEMMAGRKFVRRLM